jgi:prepilin-type N-terminal cleavage/methylation domain-containing protein
MGTSFSVGERGFTLVETIVTLAIVAVLLTSGMWMLGMHPGALAQGTDDYDAALADARALASSSGDGATLVFAPRSNRRPGFTLRVYSGRPDAADAVHPTTAMPVVSDASVSERTLGAPPFAIFLGASGDVSGQASYPALDASSNPAFATITDEPPCPAGGFALTFTSPQGASATRRLPCVATPACGSVLPNPSPTPNVPIVTPPSLVYHWPAAPRQTFVATEWGYTHWFATTTGFACSTSAATYPDVLPSPYTPAYTRAEAAASPAPPLNAPYSYPNSFGQSMNDAPAGFPLDPAAAGICSAIVSDQFGQHAHASVDVMGWLTATHGGSTYTHLSSPSLALPVSAFAQPGSAVTLPLSKSYDAQALVPHVALDAICARYLSASTAGGTTPSTPSPASATASVTLVLASVPPSQVTCGGVIYDQYNGSQSGEGIAFGATLGPSPPVTWPPAVQYPYVGFALLGCDPNQPKAYADSDFEAVLANASAPWGGYATNANGCIVKGSSDVLQADSLGNVNSGYTGGGAIAMEPAAPGGNAFSPVGYTQCNAFFNGPHVHMDPGTSGQDGYLYGDATNAGAGTCSYWVSDSNGTPQVTGGPNTNTVYLRVKSPDTCSASTNGAIYVAPGGSCTYATPQGSGTTCTPPDNAGDYDLYVASFDPRRVSTAYTSGTATIATLSPDTESTLNGPGSFTFAWAPGQPAPGTSLDVYVLDEHVIVPMMRTLTCGNADKTYAPATTISPNPMEFFL